MSWIGVYLRVNAADEAASSFISVGKCIASGGHIPSTRTPSYRRRADGLNLPWLAG
jgi:hypothetical protein